MSETAERLLSAMDLTLDDVDLVVPHQPNRMILDRLSRYLRLPKEKMFINVHRTGNMSSASIAVALDEALSSDRVGPGSLVLMVGGGAGFCAGAALIRVPQERDE
jgi:3-oxoacyl-[acyl-carrier-protein] synthase-3